VTGHFLLKGRIVQIETDSAQLVVEHEAIPGYMGAMTMPFRVRDIRALEGLRVGDEITGDLSVSIDDAWIVDLKKLNAPKGVAPLLEPANPQGAIEAAAHELAIGDAAPAISGFDDRGKSWNLSDFHGRVVAMTFIYTRCPLPTYCPLMSHNFSAARTILERLTKNSTERFEFLSLSLDASHDSADILTQYAKTFRSEPKGWLFATANNDQLRTFADAVGLEFRATPSAIDHNLRTVVIDREGRVRKIFRGNAWTPQELASEMLKAR
jgi:protein SCO1/2